MDEFKEAVDFVNKDRGRKMFEILERSPAVRRLVYAALGIGYGVTINALIRTIAEIMK